MKFCHMCGKPVDPSDRICGQCGARLFADEQAPAAQPPQQRAPQPQREDLQQTERLSQAPYAGRTASSGWTGAQRAGGGSGGYAQPGRGRSSAPIIAALAAAVVILGVLVGVMAFRGRDSGDSDSAAVTPSPETTPAPEEVEETPVTNIPYYVTGVSDQLGVRSSAGGSVVGWLENSDEVLILSDDGDYWKVRSAGGELTGYVDSHYLTVDAGSVTAPSTMYITGTSSSLGVTETQDSTREVGSVSSGDEVTVLAKTSGGSWYVYSEALHSYGYVSKDYLSAERPAEPAATPVSTPAPDPTPAPPPAGTGTALTFGYGAPPSDYTVYYASVQTGYLALRNAKAYDYSNEIGQIQNGEAVYVMTTPNETYWYVYAPTLGMYGYTNSDYLSRSGGYTAPSTYYWTVSVRTGYLALRTAKAYDYSNEIGELYTGDKVEVLDSSDGTYWYVYSPKLGKYGYVNKNYLY